MPSQIAPAHEVAPIVHGACSIKNEKAEGAHRRMILEFRTGDAILNFVNGADVARTSAGVVTPDHSIRVKNAPLILPAPEAGKLTEFRAAAEKVAQAYIDNYKAYFARHNARAGGNKIMLDPLPRVVLVPGLGLFGLGHGIGFETHEAPSLGRRASDEPMPSPTAFTVEPGVYLEGETGVRIEDLLAVDLAARRVERLTRFPREVVVVGR